MRNVFLEIIHRFSDNEDIDYNKFIMQCESMNDYLCKTNNVNWQPEIETLYENYKQNQEKLYEGLIKTYPVKSTIKKLENSGYVADYIHQSNHTKTIIVLYDKSEYNNIKKIMALYGWYEQGIYKIRGIDWIYFLPKFGLDATNDVYQNNMIIYHITNDHYIDKILKFGLQPRSQFKIEKEHPERIYCTINDPIDNKNFIKHLYSKMRANDVKNIENLYILKIDLSKCEDKNFYYDNITANGVYTHENIPPHCITIEHKLHIE